MAGINRIAFESKLNNHIFLFSKRFVLHTQLDKRYISRYEDAEPTQHRYSAATTASASTGGRAKKTQKSNSCTAHHSAVMIKPLNRLRKPQRSKITLTGVKSFYNSFKTVITSHLQAMYECKKIFSSQMT